MRLSSSKLKQIVLYGFGIFIGLALLGYIMLDLIIEFWWFSSLDYWIYFSIRDGYMGTVIVLVALMFASIFYLNFIVVPKFIEANSVAPLINEHAGAVQRLLHSRSMRIYMFLSLLLTLPLLIPVYANWEKVLLYFFSSPAGVTDPAYGRDISYYLFDYPVYQLLQNELLIAFSMLFVFIAAFYAWSYWKHQENMVGFPMPAKIHLTILIVIVVLLQGWSIILERIELLYEDRHLPVFFGPGALEMRYQLPLIWLSFFVFLGAASATIYFIHKHQGIKLIVVFTVAYFLSLGIKNFSWLPAVIEEYFIKPNPLNTEKRVMQFNIDATLNAFGLKQIKKIDYPLISSLTPKKSAEISESLYNIPLWESQLLADVYDQLQAIRPYYRFTGLATDRYHVNGKMYQVNIAARELNLDKLPKGSQTWKNRHLVYTHGYGAVVTPSGQIANQPMQWFLRDLSLTTEHPEFQLRQPDIYYGLADYDYAIVPNDSPIMANRDQEMFQEYTGNGGLAVSSMLRKLIFSTYLQEPNILFSTNIGPRSRLLIKRNIIERIKAIAPFLLLDPSPYPVIVNGRIHWIVDAYTSSEFYPNVEPMASPLKNDANNPEAINYIRNSVKIIVDAYNGSVDFYIVDRKDPLISAFDSAYPTLFKDISEMPAEFFNHLSYPKLLFRLQMQIFARYHQDTPETFYQQNERLQFSHNEPSMPFYVNLDPLEAKDQSSSEQQKFMLVENFSPIGRDNLAWISIAGCFALDRCISHYQADIYAYKFPNNLQIEGPAQIEALINQNTEISSQFSLWNQHGSKVIKGRIIIIPIEEHLLYIQPLYLTASSKTGFPQLTRVIVAMNHQTVMDTSLESAFKKLQKRLQSP